MKITANDWFIARVGGSSLDVEFKGQKKSVMVNATHKPHKKYYDADGNRIKTIEHARLLNIGKTTLQKWLHRGMTYEQCVEMARKVNEARKEKQTCAA